MEEKPKNPRKFFKWSLRPVFLVVLLVVVGLSAVTVVSQSSEYCTQNRDWCIKLWNQGRTDDVTNSREYFSLFTRETIFGTDYYIKNDSDIDYFVPTKTRKEWYSFVCAAGDGTANNINCTNDSNLEGNFFATATGNGVGSRLAVTIKSADCASNADCPVLGVCNGYVAATSTTIPGSCSGRWTEPGTCNYRLYSEGCDQPNHDGNCASSVHQYVSVQNTLAACLSYIENACDDNNNPVSSSNNGITAYCHNSSSTEFGSTEREYNFVSFQVGTTNQCAGPTSSSACTGKNSNCTWTAGTSRSVSEILGTCASSSSSTPNYSRYECVQIASTLVNGYGQPNGRWVRGEAGCNPPSSESDCYSSHHGRGESLCCVDPPRSTCVRQS